MSDPYPIILLPADARSRVEQMGTKEKFWFTHSDGAQWLFKFNRPGHGDDWSEKIATEIANLIGLPHARVEFASFENKSGIISRDFTDRGRFPLIHGNELLFNAIGPSYPKDRTRRVNEHTVENVRHILDDPRYLQCVPVGSSATLAREYTKIDGVTSASDLFAGYLMLDALVGNTDRHHENWAIVRVATHYCIAPTFDHASSLGFNLLDAERIDRMTPGRNRSVESFAERASSKLYLDGEDKPLTPLMAFAHFTNDLPAARGGWIDRLRLITDNQFGAIIDRVPSERMSAPARKFTFALLKLNRDRILGL